MMPNKVKPSRSWVANYAPTSLEANELAINWQDAKAYTRNPSGQIISITLGGGGSSSIVEVATAAGFPATGSAGTLYHATNSSRIYFWDTSGVYVEAGTSGGGGSGDGTDSVLRALFVPGAPTSVTASAGNAQATVSWTAPTGVIAQAPITDYVVQFSSNSGSSWSAFSDGTATATSTVVTSLTNGTAYTFRVAAVNGIGQGAWSTASSAVTPAAGDAYWDNVTLLIHGDGSITDSSKYARSLTISGASVSSTAKFGSGSVSARGGNMVQYFNNWTAIGAGDFTIEAWVYSLGSGNGGGNLLFGNGPGGTYWAIDWGAEFDIKLYGPNIYGLARASIVGSSLGEFSMNLNEWYHLAVCRENGYVRGFINGIPTGSSAVQITTNFNGTNLFIGDNYRGDGSDNQTVLMDELRITAASRYGLTSSFTPPTAAFPNS